MIHVRILGTNHVLPSRVPIPLLEHIKLSFFDTIWVAFPPIQRVFLYEGADLPPFASLLEALKSSLAKILADYYPLAGKLTYLAASGDAEIDCSADAVGAGVAFAEAEAEGDLHRLAADEAHDIEAFLRLVPAVDSRELPVPVLAVQVTAFAGGGVAVGLALHHAAADGRAMWGFVEAWTAACRLAMGSPSAGPAAEEEHCVAPAYDRAVIRHPREDQIARRFLKEMAPDLPRTAAPMLDRDRRLRHARVTFVVNAEGIRSLKQRALRQRGESNGPPPSTFVVLAAHAWAAFARSKGLDPSDSAHVAFLADLRSRLDPPLDEGYFGNCIKICHVSARVGDLLAEEDGLGRACGVIQTAIHDALTEPLERCEEWITEFMKLPFVRVTNVAGSPRFKVYETDFGWGRPSRVELVSMNHDGEVVLVAARDGTGVQVSVALNPNHMEAYKAHFLGGLRNI